MTRTNISQEFNFNNLNTFIYVYTSWLITYKFFKNNFNGSR